MHTMSHARIATIFRTPPCPHIDEQGGLDQRAPRMHKIPGYSRASVNIVHLNLAETCTRNPKQSTLIPANSWNALTNSAAELPGPKRGSPFNYSGVAFARNNKEKENNTYQACMEACGCRCVIPVAPAAFHGGDALFGCAAGNPGPAEERVVFPTSRYWQL